MKTRTNLVLTGFAVAVVAVAALILWTEHTAWQQVGQLRRQFGALQIESFRFADHVEAGIRGLNDKLLRYDLHDEPADRERFLGDSRELKDWMATNKEHLTTTAERNLFGEILQEYDRYLESVTQLLEAPRPAERGQFSARLFDQMEASSARLLELCEQLDASHRTALGVFVADSHGAMVRLQWLLWLSLFLLVALGASLAVLVYRGMIAPLRSQLIVSRALLERQEKLSSLGVLAAGVAHEIRNPLTALKVRLHGLKKALPQDPSLHEDVEVIGTEINRLEKIVRDFLQFARPSDPELSPLPVAPLLREVHDLLASQLEKQVIRLALETTDSARARLDPQQIKQVLINLVRNAADSIERDGSITLRSRSRNATVNGRELPAVVIEVEDTGRGMTPEVRRRLFDPFFTTKEHGTGLGLSIAARIVEKHGGMLQCHTQPGRGTTFSVVLPRAESDES
ncbi:MAG: hypothetical protein KIS67_14830 [Verrucomicrobiae bacterium]|nr:hypothetical protein [Verrucomicrobiae bacterium]